jgi:hypothetical protein
MSLTHPVAVVTGHRQQKHLLLRCPPFNQARDLAIDNIINKPSFDGDMFLNSNQEDKFHLLLHGHHNVRNSINSEIITITAGLLIGSYT